MFAPFERHPNETVEFLFRGLKEIEWKHQPKKIEQVKACLKDLQRIDDIAAELKRLNLFQDPLEIMKSINPEIVCNFSDTLWHHMQQAIMWMEKEEEPIEEYNREVGEGHWTEAIREKSPAELRDAGGIENLAFRIESDGVVEKSKAHKMREWIKIMINIIIETIKKTNVPSLHELADVLKDLYEHLQLIEAFIKFEERRIKHGKAVHA